MFAGSHFNLTNDRVRLASSGMGTLVNWQSSCTGDKCGQIN